VQTGSFEPFALVKVKNRAIPAPVAAPADIYVTASMRAIRLALVHGCTGEAFARIVDIPHSINAWEALLDKYEPQCESSAAHYAIMMVEMVLDSETTEALMLCLERIFNTLLGLGTDVPDALRKAVLTSSVTAISS
jgi:hypothetical protein